MIKNKQVAGGVVIAGFLAIITLLGPTAGLTPLVNTASAAYGGGGSRAKVTLCHNNQTIKVASSAVVAHLAHGDKRGACPAVLGETTTAQKEEIAKLQLQLVSLLQQLIVLLNSQK